MNVRDASPDAVAIEIHNVGPPIPKDVQDRLFDAFRGATTHVPSSKGLGLGLFIVREVVRAH